MHLSSSTTTGTLVAWLASGMSISFSLRCDRRRVAQMVVGAHLVGGARHDVGIDRALAMRDAALVVLVVHAVAEPVVVVGLGKIDAQVVEAPAAFGAIERSRRSQVGAVEDRLGLERAHQLVRIARD